MISLDGFSRAISETVNGILEPSAAFLEEYVWAWPSSDYPLLVGLLLGAGLYVTLRLAFIQVRGFRHAINITRGVYDDPAHTGDLNHFRALTTALSATVGIGNIAGVAIAIRLGGPGALLWMWVTAFFGMALKFAECTLAVKFRKVNADGSISGGPMYYIERGMGKNWKWMAIFFAACAAISSFGGGCMNQSNTLAVQIESDFGLPTIWSAIIFSALLGAVIIGGIKRIGRVTSVLAPGMASLYVAGALTILVLNVSAIPAGLTRIVTEAFAPEPLAGGAVGSFMLTLMWGIRRGLFSNEAGQGSAPIAHATAKTDEPVREGLVASLGPFIDTLVICTMTGLVIVMTGVYKDRVEQTLPLSSVEALLVEDARDERIIGLRKSRETLGGGTMQVVDGKLADGSLVSMGLTVEAPRFSDADRQPWSGTLLVDPDGAVSVAADSTAPTLVGGALLTGAALTAYGFKTGLPGDWGNYLVTIAVILFAVSTGISWSYYGDRAVEYLFGSRAIRVYRWVFIFMFFLGSILPLSAVWKFGDVALGLMSIPNLIALIFLSGSVVTMTRTYYSKQHKRFR